MPAAAKTRTRRTRDPLIVDSFAGGGGLSPEWCAARGGQEMPQPHGHVQYWFRDAAGSLRVRVAFRLVRKKLLLADVLVSLAAVIPIETTAEFRQLCQLIHVPLRPESEATT